MLLPFLLLLLMVLNCNLVFDYFLLFNNFVIHIQLITTVFHSINHCIDFGDFLSLLKLLIILSLLSFLFNHFL